MNQLLIQAVLIAAVIAVVVRLFRSRGARSQALRRIGLVVFAVLAVVSILVPELWNAIARVVGVARGVDIVLYALVVAFLSFTVTTYLRFRDMENAYTRLARRIAIDEAHRRRRELVDPQPPPPGSPGEPDRPSTDQT